MAACGHCKKSITSAQARTMVNSYDENGRLEGALHGKCFSIRKHWYELINGKYVKKRRDENAPNVYDASMARKTKDDMTPEAQEDAANKQAELEALRIRQSELAEQRNIEESRDLDAREDDWREPSSIEI